MVGAAGRSVTACRSRGRARAELTLLAFVASFLVALSPVAASEVTIELFTRSGCPRCVEARSFLDELAKRRTDLSVRVRDVNQDAAALARLEKLAADAGVRAPGVPSFLVRDKLVVGWISRQTTGSQIESALAIVKPGPLAVPGPVCPVSGRPPVRRIPRPTMRSRCRCSGR